jgi:hypothetical protein
MRVNTLLQRQHGVAKRSETPSSPNPTDLHRSRRLPIPSKAPAPTHPKLSYNCPSAWQERLHG